jgi:PRTRC genetic system protein A
MAILADDPTAAAVLDAVPCYPVPPSGRSPAVDDLRAARDGHGLAVGADGVMRILRRPWLALDAFIAPPLTGHLPYGSVGQPAARLRCGLIPREHLLAIMRHFTAALPNEAAAFVLWNEQSREFEVVFPDIDCATPARLVYRTPFIEPGWHLVCDIHSHGAGGTFFSPTDNADDAHATKIAMVVGRIGTLDGPTMEGRICAAGMFLPMPRSPFAGEHDAA